MSGAGGEHRAIEPAEQAAAMMTAAGMPRMPARVMMALVAAPGEGYTAADLADRLGVSAAAVSGAVRYLQRVHFIRRRAVPGDRRDRYELVPEVFYGSMTSNTALYEHSADLMDRIADETSDDAVAQERAAEMAAFFRFLAERMPRLIDEWEHRRSAGA
ncbi:GbsR/MarR family transcriptional regulator [Microbacterium fluvii]|uniref:GbsR/MarR family transcriptional regulator n=1 Tax=Microbacterium fluvii TaxID=415215 RepID=A0ABW2HFL6_9MICO|nr:MarR family transcriptional regulator [Microbacterium fluvii]MCU4672947.1 MarR family transcriptional regulator [Microbacterium fluvii]